MEDVLKSGAVGVREIAVVRLLCPCCVRALLVNPYLARKAVTALGESGLPMLTPRSAACCCNW